MPAPPILFVWTGEAFAPLPRFTRECDRHFVVGERYLLAEHQERSVASHRHYFASLSEAWSNLPEEHGDRFPTVEHLRRFVLIKAGFRDERTIVAGSRAEALRIAAFIKPMDEFAFVVVSEAAVTVYTAKSQSLVAMGKADFQASKQAVLDYAWGLCGVDAETAGKHSGRAA